MQNVNNFRGIYLSLLHSYLSGGVTLEKIDQYYLDKYTYIIHKLNFLFVGIIQKLAERIVFEIFFKIYLCLIIFHRSV